MRAQEEALIEWRVTVKNLEVSVFVFKHCYKFEHCYTSDLGSSQDILMLLSARIEEAVLILPFPSTIVLSVVFLGSSKASLSSIKVSSALLLGPSSLFLG